MELWNGWQTEAVGSAEPRTIWLTPVLRLCHVHRLLVADWAASNCETSEQPWLFQESNTMSCGKVRAIYFKSIFVRSYENDSEALKVIMKGSKVVTTRKRVYSWAVTVLHVLFIRLRRMSHRSWKTATALPLFTRSAVTPRFPRNEIHFECAIKVNF